ncbi:MAG: lipopolysaccharide biosynthesis protein [Candidatus Bipolaricaulis sibiricus]|uniref:Lipopolysaccharide biosynthesis protein n=1 Tax=Bipolaricaulis sibiricus TaxID=2501609 RepID=A0A410FT27_BIPS1|nr:MAG: lipopolysaccharide biosynthesis protein [Candidatus Bipolaricaulis sibiricus]
MGLRATACAWVRNTVLRALPRGRFARSVTVLAGGAALGQAITVLVSPILTRLYSPEDFGIFGVYASMLGIITVIASLRYEYAIPLPEDDETAANILALCFVLLLGMTTLSWFVIQGLGSRITSWANVPGLRRYLWLVPLGILGAGTYQVLNYWAVRKRDFRRIARTRVSRGVGRAAIQVGVGFASAGPLGLLLGQLAGETAGSASLGWAAWVKDRSSLKAINLAGMRRAGARYRRFPLLSSWGGLLDALGLHVPQVLFAAFYGAEVAGWFALGQRVIAAPLNLVGDSVAQVYFGEAARLPRDDTKAMRRLFLKLTGRLALTGGLPVAVICALAPWLFTIFFGPEWETAGRYVQILGLMFAVRFAIVPLAHTLNILERQDLYLFWDGTRAALVVGSLLMGKVVGFSHIAAVGTYSLAMLIAYIILWGLAWHALKVKSRGGGQEA